jgi:gamma-tubulin complex component 5
MSLLVEKCLVHHIHKRAQDVQFTLASHLRDKLDVKHELNALRSLFLGGAGDAATQFYDAVFAILDDAK